MPYDTISPAVADRIVTLSVNGPDKLNALNERVIAELGLAIEALRQQDDIRIASDSAKFGQPHVKLGLIPALEATGFGLLANTDDRREGKHAFLEKRPAAFTGA